MSPEVCRECGGSHHGVGEVAHVAEGFLGRAIPLVLVGRRVDGGNAELAASLLEEAVDVDRLCVGLDGYVFRSVAALLDVVQELVERVRSIRLLLQEVGVGVTG